MARKEIWHPGIPSHYRNAIVTGDMRELSEALPDNSVDLFFTDPPYNRDSLYLYDLLGAVAARVLKPGGFCLAMCGGLYINRIFATMDKHLGFFWKYEVALTGWATGIVWPNGNNKVTIIVRSKPLLAYSKGKGLPRTSTLGSFRGTGQDKRYHVWGQDEASTRYYIDCFSAVGDVVCDPLCGGGTMRPLCVMLKRNYTSFEIDPDVAQKARTRVLNRQPLLFMEELDAPLQVNLF